MTVVPVTVLALLLAPEDYRSYWRTFRFVDWWVVPLSLTALCGFVGGVAAAMLLSKGPAVRPGVQASLLNILVERHAASLAFWYRVTFILTVTGYLLWFGAAWFKGLSWDELQSVLLRRDNAIYALKDFYFQTIPGVTTFTQFGMAFMTIGALRALGGAEKSIWWSMGAVLSMGFLRAYFLSERLAIIELVVPPAVLAASQLGVVWKTRSALRRNMLNCAPLIGALTLIVFFASAEFFRSWIVFSNATEWSLVEFSLLRLTGYYVTALNNSMYLLDLCDGAEFFPGLTLDWFYRFPLIGQVFQVDSPLRSLERDGNFSILQNGANPEFTNPGGLLVPLIDYGWVGGFLFWLVVGFVVGRLWSSLLAVSLPGLLLYPMVFIGLLEIVRIPYLFLGRSVPSLALLSLVSLAYTPIWNRRRLRLRVLLHGHHEDSTQGSRA